MLKEKKIVIPVTLDVKQKKGMSDEEFDLYVGACLIKLFENKAAFSSYVDIDINCSDEEMFKICELLREELKGE